MTLRDTIHPGLTQPVLIVCALHTDILFDMLAAVIEVEVEFNTIDARQRFMAATHFLIQLTILNNIRSCSMSTPLPSCPTSDCDTHNIPDIPDVLLHKSAERGSSIMLNSVPASEGYAPSFNSSQSSSVPRSPRCHTIIAMRVDGAQRFFNSKPQLDNPLLDFNNCMSRKISGEFELVYIAQSIPFVSLAPFISSSIHQNALTSSIYPDDLRDGETMVVRNPKPSADLEI
ncbi:hypothetical protein C8R43DRAFT_1123068 [Mycena crocata]|nr:hypothetical protein C8R43DRAFT_1123068 [Mycena crocata]